MSDLQRITALAAEQLRLEREIAGLEEQMKSAKDLHRQISETDLPEAMDAAEMEEFIMKDGRKVSIKQTYHGEIPKDPERRSVAFSWLREHGHDSIIKRVIRIEFGVGEDKKAKNLFDRIRRYKNLVDNTIVGDESVHPQTFKSFVKRSMEEGEDLPTDTFGIYIRRFAEIGAVKR